MAETTSLGFENLMADDDSILDYTWLVTITPNPEEKDKPTLRAGALCVGEDGILLTVTHGIRVSAEQPDIKVNAHNGIEMEAEIIDTIAGEAFGITVLRVLNVDGKKFKYIELSDDMNMPVNTGTKILGCIHDMIHHFNLENGLVGPSFPGNLRVPRNILGTFTCTSSTSSLQTNIGHVATRENVGFPSICISKITRICQQVGDSVFETCALLNQSVPLIQVSGLGYTMLDGQCGCPVFIKKGEKLLGLFFLSTGYNQFIIPAFVLKQVFDESRSLWGTSL